MANLFPLTSVSPMQKASASGSSRKKLEDSCRQFEGFFLAELMKKSKEAGVASLGENKKTFGALEETALEMSARSISEEGEGLGLWKVLYDDLCRSFSEEGDSLTDPVGEEGDA